VRFSFANVALQALSHNSGWPEQWRNAEPKAAYDAVIIGAGGHGLATAYYLAKEHGLANVAVTHNSHCLPGNLFRVERLPDFRGLVADHPPEKIQGMTRRICRKRRHHSPLFAPCRFCPRRCNLSSPRLARCRLVSRRFSTLQSSFCLWIR